MINWQNCDKDNRPGIEEYAYQAYIESGRRGITMVASLSERVRRTPLKSQRLMARISEDQKSLLQRAAEICGQTLTEFVVSAAQDAATRAIVDQEVIDFSLSDSRAFAEGMLNPPPVGTPLRAAAKRYRKIMGS
jgi:uncharacterized protein (DUF1778 family)